MAGPRRRDEDAPDRYHLRWSLPPGGAEPLEYSSPQTSLITRDGAPRLPGRFGLMTGHELLDGARAASEARLGDDLGQETPLIAQALSAGMLRDGAPTRGAPDPPPSARPSASLDLQSHVRLQPRLDQHYCAIVHARERPPRHEPARPPSADKWAITRRHGSGTPSVNGHSTEVRQRLGVFREVPNGRALPEAR